MVKRILVCPLDWGLGHATRCVAIIEQLINKGFEVIIGADKAPLLFLRQIFPSIPYIIMPSYSVKYTKKGKLMPWKMLLLIPKILIGIKREHQLLKILLKVNQIDIVISDNRYGLWNKSVYCIFITHQLNILIPKWLKIFEPVTNLVNHFYICKYNECWVPDVDCKESFAGILSHPVKSIKNTNYIGILSRFTNTFLENPHYQKEFDVMFLLSGPEPQRGILEKIILEQISNLPYKCLLVQGKPSESFFFQSPKLQIVNHLKSAQLSFHIKNVPFILSRSGYSSIMDFIVLNKHAIIIPTPGQTEQEYLADYTLNKKWFFSVKQDELKLEEVINEFNSFDFEEFPEHAGLLDKRLTKLL
jgi:uncharacterized protein (TIGR00661 family)